MDCKKALELIWEKEAGPELEEHLKTCESCQRDRALIEKLHTSFCAPDRIVENTMKKIKKEKRRHTLLNITKIAAALVVVAALAFFAKSYITSNTKAENDAGVDNEAAVGTTDRFDTYSDVVVDMEPEEPSVEAEEDVLHDVTTPSQTVDFNDLYIRLFSFKDSLLLTSKSCDFVVDANESEVLKALAPYSPELIDGYILLDSDFTHEVTESLTNAGIEILITTSSESVSKTFIFFANNI